MKEAGYTVLVVDHHVAKAGYPDADVVIDQSDGIKDEAYMAILHTVLQD